MEAIDTLVEPTPTEDVDEKPEREMGMVVEYHCGYNRYCGVDG